MSIREEFNKYLQAQGFSDNQINEACLNIPETAIITGITREVAIRDYLRENYQKGKGKNGDR